MDWHLEVGLCSGPGRVRRENEDAWYMHRRAADPTTLPGTFTLSEDIPAGVCLFGVCDGVRGSADGAAAACLAVSRLRELEDRLAARGDFEMETEDWVDRVNPAIRRAAPGAGTTLALLGVGPDGAQSANLGDSRVCRVRGGHVEALSQDHTQTQLLLEAGVIGPEQARTHPGRHTLTRCLGMPGDVGGSVFFGPRLPVVAGDVFLLCSDGVTRGVPDEGLARAAAEEGSAAACAERIYREAMEAGGFDNATVIAVRVLAAREGGRFRLAQRILVPPGHRVETACTVSADGGGTTLEQEIRITEDGS